MKQRHFLLVLLTMVAGIFVNAQTRMVEKITKSGNEIVIPYEKYVLPNGLTAVSPFGNTYFS